MRIFQWLVLTLSDRDDHYLGVLTDIEQRWADQVADVLDEEPGSRLRIQCLDRLLDHRCIEVASGSGIHLNCAGASPPDAVTVKGGFLVALNDTDRDASPRSAMVRSSREVFPEPGELIRFSAVMPR